jgi:peptidoglycan/xylan/chitin deacetylase (PgdA/CDA1 family)
MGALQKIKRTILATKGMGLASAISRTNWRRQRLLILCYHGIAMGDEHESHPEMFLPPAIFAQRMQVLAESGCRVISLDEGLIALQKGTLPESSVAITFDDGWADFKHSALPIVKRYGFPITIYLTTYYCLFSRPIFRFALSHMMWRLRSKIVENRAFSWLPEQLDLRSEKSRSAIICSIDEYAKRQDLSGEQKDDLVAGFAETIGFDYSAFCKERLFQLLNPEEVTSMARSGIDIQLHTHRHRTPLVRDRFIAEVTENRQLIAEMTGKGNLVHFCYPSGAFRDDFVAWLKEAGVRSATTCESGLSAKADNLYRLPRLLDQYGLIDTEFGSWLSGLAAFLPRRKSISVDVAPE